MADDLVGVRVEGGVATVTLQRPAMGNALDLATSIALGDALESLDWPSLSALVLRGSGNAFCVGGDLREMAAAPDRGQHLAQLAGAAHRAIRILAACESPVIAVVDGAAAGAGLALTLVADVVLVGDRATFTVAYPLVGLSPDCGTSWMLPRTVGRRVAARMALLGARVGADEAVQAGLATVHVSSDQLDVEVARTLQAITTAGRLALRDTKSLLAGDAYEGFSEHLDREARRIAARASSPEASALIDRFLSQARAR